MAVESLYQNNVESRTAGYMPVFGQKKPENTASFASELSKTVSSETAKTAPSPAAGGEEKDPGGFLSFLFGILDVLNPLQHIPVVSTIYRHLTGDEISPLARIAGGALYGGPVGAAASAVNVAVETTTGKDIGENVLAMMTGGGEEAHVMTASAMNGISPASGAGISTEIIWADEAAPQTAALFATDIPLPTLPQHLPHPAAELQTASYSYKAAPPDLPSKGDASASVFLTATERGTGEETPGTPRAETLPALHPQEAPADDARTARQPELIAFKMMDALDKYSAMKRAGL